MKKIKLKESDVLRIVKRTIRESQLINEEMTCAQKYSACHTFAGGYGPAEDKCTEDWEDCSGLPRGSGGQIAHDGGGELDISVDNTGSGPCLEGNSCGRDADCALNEGCNPNTMCCEGAPNRYAGSGKRRGRDEELGEQQTHYGDGWINPWKNPWKSPFNPTTWNTGDGDGGDKRLRESDLARIIKRTINESQLLTEMYPCTSEQKPGTSCSGPQCEGTWDNWSWGCQCSDAGGTNCNASGVPGTNGEIEREFTNDRTIDTPYNDPNPQPEGKWVCHPGKGSCVKIDQREIIAGQLDVPLYGGLFGRRRCNNNC